jgi:hypothetical protein
VTSTSTTWRSTADPFLAEVDAFVTAYRKLYGSPVTAS